MLRFMELGNVCKRPKDNEEFDQDVGSRRSNASSYVRLPPKDNEEFDQDVGSRRSNASSYVRLSVSMALSMPTN